MIASVSRIISGVLLSVVILASVALPQHARADGGIFGPQQEQPSLSSLTEVDRALYLELINLSRFNAKFHQESNYHQPWRAWTYPLGRESGTAASFAGTLVDISQQAKGFNKPKLISKNAVKYGIASTMTGNAISGSASALELAQNFWVMRKAKKHGYSPKESVQYVRSIVSRTTALLEQRKELVAAETNPNLRKAHEIETALIRRIRRQLLYEFRTWSCHSRDQAWRENTFFAIDAAQSFTRMAASIRARQALNDSKLAGSGIVCALISTSAATINPIFKDLVGLGVRKYQEHKLAKEFPVERPDLAEGMSVAELTEFEKNHPESRQEQLLTSAILLSQRTERLDVHIDRDVKEINRYREVAQQQSVSGPIIGFTGLAGAICSTVGFWGYRDNPRTANRISFSGRISNAAGQAYALVNTPYTAIDGWRKNRQLKKRGELPSQIIEQRLRNLDEFEHQVRSFSPH